MKPPQNMLSRRTCFSGAHAFLWTPDGQVIDHRWLASLSRSCSFKVTQEELAIGNWQRWVCFPGFSMFFFLVFFAYCVGWIEYPDMDHRGLPKRQARFSRFWYDRFILPAWVGSNTLIRTIGLAKQESPFSTPSVDIEKGRSEFWCSESDLRWVLSFWGCLGLALLQMWGPLNLRPRVIGQFLTQQPPHQMRMRVRVTEGKMKHRHDLI